MSWKEESLKRILKVAKLQQDCMKHLQKDTDALANQILMALLKSSSRKGGPVKLSEVSEELYGNTEKDKQDVIRLTIEKTLLRCGIVDKIRFSDRDVRYIATAYRFQEVSRVETSTGAKIDQLVGDVTELPRQYWPVPREVFDLIISKAAYEEALVKLQEDSKRGLISPQLYERNKTRFQKSLENASRKLHDYEAVTALLT